MQFKCSLHVTWHFVCCMQVTSLSKIWITSLVEMLKRRLNVFLLRSFARSQSRCQLLFSRSYRLRSVHVVSSFACLVNYVNCGDCWRFDQPNMCLYRPQPMMKRFFTALHHNVNTRASMLPALSSRVSDLQWPLVNMASSRLRSYGKPLPNVRWFTLSPKAIVEASPLYIQPYLRLIRLDRPIGMLLTICFWLCVIPLPDILYLLLRFW